VEYVNNKIKVKLYCKECEHFFNIRPDAHLNGKGCNKCGYIKSSMKRMSTKEHFIDICQKIHGDRYNYDKTKYTSTNKKVNIVCKKHGEFMQLASNHMSGAGCPKCSNSSGEDYISEKLKNMGIEYIREKSFDDCFNTITNSKYFFDFYLPEYNMIIEYDGKQHYFPIEFFGGEDNLIKTKLNDIHKTSYCYNKNIFLLRITYLDVDKIDLILNNFFNKYE